MLSHLFDEPVVVIAARRALQIARSKTTIVPQPIDDGHAVLPQAAGDPARHVRRNHRQVLGPRELYDRPVVGRVARPWARRGEELFLGGRAAHVLVDRTLHVTLEHLQADGQRCMPAQEPFEHGDLQRVRVRIVVLFADQHDVGAHEIREHALEIGERLALRVVHALRHVRHRHARRMGKRRRRRLKQRYQSEEDGDHRSIVGGIPTRVNAGLRQFLMLDLSACHGLHVNVGLRGVCGHSPLIGSARFPHPRCAATSGPGGRRRRAVDHGAIRV